MRRPFLLILLLFVGIGTAAAEAPPAVAPGTPRSITLQPVAIYDGAGNIVASFGGGPSTGTGSTSAFAASTTSTQALPLAGSGRKFLAIVNESVSAAIACAFGGTAALNTAGSFTIPPGATRTWNGSFVPADAVNCIAASPATPVTIQAN